jgi:hypothetical protein
MILTTLLAAAAGASIPTAFTGEWIDARYACNTGQSHMRLHIGRHGLDDGEFDARIDNVTILSPVRIKVKATWLSAEDSQLVVSTFTLDKGGNALLQESRSSDGKPFTTHWARCR